MTEGNLESVSTGPGDMTATEGAVDGIGAGSLPPTAGLIGESFAEVVDGMAVEPKSWVGTGAGESFAEVVDKVVVEPKSRVGTGTGEGASAVLGFASRPGSKLPPRGGESK